MVRKKVVLTNSISGVCQLIVTALLTFFSIPIFINKLGTEVYGIFALVSVIGNLNLFTNLGLDVSLTKYIAEQGKCDESNKDIIASLGLTLSIVLPISIVIYIYHHYLLIDILEIPLNYYEQAKSLFYSLLIANVILLIGQPFIAVLNGLQRIYLSNFLQLVYSVIYWLGTIVVLLLGYHLETIGKIILVASLVWFTTAICFFLYYWGKISIKYSLKNLALNVKKQVRYGSKIYASGIISFLNEPLFKIIISNVFGISAVAYFEIALKIRGQVTGLFSKIMQPLFPYISQLTDKQNISYLIKEVTLKTLFLVIPVCSILLLSCKDIVILWLRTDIYNYTLFISGIVVPYLILSPLTLPIYMYLMAKGHPEKTIIIQLSSVIVNIFSFYILYNFLGIYTIIISNILSYLASFLLGLYYQYIYLGIKYHPVWRNYINLCILIIGYFIVGYLQQYINNELISILFVIVLILIVTLKLYKRFTIITRNDITHYFLDNKFIVSLYNKL